jgi:hypothetical protein
VCIPSAVAFLQVKKKDDLCDTLCQTMAFLIQRYVE